MMLLRVGVPKRATTWHAVSSASVGSSALTMTRRQSVVASDTGKDVEYQTSTVQIVVVMYAVFVDVEYPPGRSHVPADVLDGGRPVLVNCGPG